MVAALSLDFEDALSAREVEEAVADIERKACAAHPDVVALFVKPQARWSSTDGLTGVEGPMD